MLKTVVLLNIFVKTMIHFFSGFFNEWNVQKSSYTVIPFLQSTHFSIVKVEFAHSISTHTGLNIIYNMTPITLSSLFFPSF